MSLCLPPRRPLRLRLLPRHVRLLLLAGALLLADGCRALDAPPPLTSIEPGATTATAAPLHWPVPPAAPLLPGQSRLWVALARRLGPQPDQDASRLEPLRLVRAGPQPLTLITADNRRLTAPDMVLHWRWLPLPQPLVWRRRVLGPYASFESAEQAALEWRRQGVAAVVANPGEWEVWAPAAAPAPPGREAPLRQRRETRRAVLELRRPNGALPLPGPLRLIAPSGLLWRGGVYGGPFRLQGDAYGSWTLVEEVPLERYLEGVLPHEIGAGAPAAALEAQAVLARTWALRNSHRFQVDGFHLCADTQCQVYADPRLASAAVRQAIERSRDQVLSWRGQPIHAVYHATNGGIAAAYEEVWSGAPLPYLRSFADGPASFARQFPPPLAAEPLQRLLRQPVVAYGADHPLFRWQRTLTAADLAKAAAGGGPPIGTVQRLEVLERGPSGRVLALRIAGSKGILVLRRDAIRRRLRQLPSTLFVLMPASAGSWRLVGGGFGHGAGLSQSGAIDLARQGWSASRILSRYYPQTQLRSAVDLAGGGNAGQAP
ncbi:MAG: SpoIID/LytB domain-containing protein [Synechococcaceae cyanobacterium]|nr:SpoIID/LytB domain-containing protein [Synechococcaceae cyanobacterium]